MRIVITSDIYYPMINGVASFARNLAGGMKKRGHQVMVIAPSITGNFSVEKDEEYGFTVVRLKSRRIFIYPDQINTLPEEKKIFGVKLPQLVYKNGMNVSFMPQKEIRQVLDEFKPDIIHNQTQGPVAIAILRYAQKHDIALVSTDHAYPDNLTQQVKLPAIAKKPINKAMNAYFMRFLRKSEYATMPTERAIADLIPKNSKRFNVPVEAISNGIDLSRFAKGRANREIYDSYGIPKGKPIVLYVGRIDPEKSLDILVKSFQRTLDSVPEAELVMVGEGTARAKLEELATKLNIRDKLHCLGRVVGDDLPQIYRTGTVFAITSKTETQSIVLMEAMASGLPAVAVAAGAVSELVKNNKNGFLCEPDDIEAVAKSLAKLLANPDLRKRFSDDTLKRIRKHDISYTLTRMEEIYNEVLDSREQQS